jgi:hypothetical protein
MGPAAHITQPSVVEIGVDSLSLELPEGALFLPSSGLFHSRCWQYLLDVPPKIRHPIQNPLWKGLGLLRHRRQLRVPCLRLSRAWTGVA